MLTLVASALAGGDCIDDADALRAGGTAGVLGLRSQGAIHPGDLPAQLSLGPRPSTRPREPPVAGPGMASRGRTRRLAPDHRPGLHHLRDLRMAKEGARHHGYTGVRGYHPLLAIAAGTGDVLMARLREGQANTVRGAGHFLRETVGRVRYAGARGQLTVRADSGFYTHAIVAVCRRMDVRFSITIRQHASCAISSRRYPRRTGRPFLTGWTVPPMWPRPPTPPSRVRRTPRRCGSSSRAGEADAGSQLALFATYSYHGFITDRGRRNPGAGGRSPPPTPRSRTPYATSSTASG